MSKNPTICIKMPPVLIIAMILSAFISDLFALDNSRYIGLDEIKPGMEGYALTVYSGTLIEKFPVKVVSVARQIQPGKDAIFVIGTDPRFIHTGPVQGCSGSPVYIDGRIAGALAFGWGFAKDALYGVTPIGEMLEISKTDFVSDPWSMNAPARALDYYCTLDPEKIYKQLTTVPEKQINAVRAGYKGMECPLLTTLPIRACPQLEGFAESMGLSVVPGVGSGSGGVYSVPNFEPGSVMAVPLVDGDIKMAVVGTATEVDGDNVYGFGHPFTGMGGINLPLSTGYVHMVVANMISSFKFAQSGQLVGALRADQSAGVYGVLGETAPTIPLKLRVKTYLKPESQEFNCRLAVNNLITPMLVQSVLAGTLTMQSDFPELHTVSYSARISLDGHDDIVIKNVSSQSGPIDVLMDMVMAVGVVMNNPFERPVIKNIEVDMELEHKDVTAKIWALQADKATLKPGDDVMVRLTLESLRSSKREYQLSFKLPENIAPGNYQLMVGGRDMYLGFLRKSASYKFATDNFDTLMSAVDNLNAIKRDRIYCVFEMPGKGISIDDSPIMNMPMSKMAPLVSENRSVQIKPLSDWIEKYLDCGYVLTDSRVLNITIEEE